MFTASRRVLHLTGMQCAKFGSFERYLLEVVRECKRRGFASTLQYEASPLPPDYANALAELGATVVVGSTVARNWQTGRNVWHIIQQAEPSIINAHFIERHTLLASAIAGRILGVQRVISTVHGVYHLQPNSLARYAYNSCDYVLPVSQGAGADLKHGRVKTQLIHPLYLGLFGDERFSATRRAAVRESLGIAQDAIVIGNIAFDAPIKGVESLLRSLPAVLNSFPNVILIQIGVDPASSALPRLASDLGIAESVRWIGIRDSGCDYLHAADIYVQPSQCEGGVPLAMMEAMRLGLPVVATRVVGNSEGVIDGETGRFVSPNAPEFLSDGLCNTIGDKSRWATMGIAGRARFEAMFQGERSVDDLVTKFYGIGRRNS